MRQIFVFGSNLAGIHGAGAALYAYENCGAEWGVGEGPTGNAYALPTKDENIRSRPWSSIAKSLEIFSEYARDHPAYLFLLTPVGTGLAGFDRRLLWSTLKSIGLPDNVVLTASWVND